MYRALCCHTAGTLLQATSTLICIYYTAPNSRINLAIFATLSSIYFYSIACLSENNGKLPLLPGMDYEFFCHKTGILLQIVGAFFCLFYAISSTQTNLTMALTLFSIYFYSVAFVQRRILSRDSVV